MKSSKGPAVQACARSAKPEPTKVWERSSPGSACAPKKVIVDSAVSSVFYRARKEDAEQHPAASWTEKSDWLRERQRSVWPIWFDKFARLVHSREDNWFARRILGHAAQWEDYLDFEFFVFQLFCSAANGTDPYSALLGHLAGLEKVRSHACKLAQRERKALIAALDKAQNIEATLLAPFDDIYNSRRERLAEIANVLRVLEQTPAPQTKSDTNPPAWPRPAWTVLWLHEKAEGSPWQDLSYPSHLKLLESAISASPCKPSYPRPTPKSMGNEVSKLRKTHPKWFRLLEVAVRSRIWTLKPPFTVPQFALRDLHRLRRMAQERPWYRA